MASLNLKLKTKTGQIIVNSLTSLNTIAELKAHISSVTKIPTTDLYVLSGFPPSPIDLTSNEKTLQASNIKSGDTLIVEVKVVDVIQHEYLMDTQRHIIEQQYADSPGILMKKVVPADNSCLFTSIAFVIEGKIDTERSTFMREIIAEAVSNDEVNYSEAILGKPNRDYCNWIKKPDSWGGAIELAVLSKFYGLEIAVVDTVNGIINIFGEDQQYDQRVFLLFDGVHYDPLYLEPLEPSGMVRTIFSTSDDQILNDAKQLALEANSSRQYTDTNRFKLRCIDCDVKMVGITEVRNHTKETGHNNFGEINK